MARTRFRSLLNRGQPLTAHAAAIRQRRFAAFGRITVQKPMLPLAANLRRLILAFHKIKNSALSGARKLTNPTLSVKHLK
jgi:hypothetical protein